MCPKWKAALGTSTILFNRSILKAKRDCPGDFFFVQRHIYICVYMCVYTYLFAWVCIIQYIHISSSLPVSITVYVCVNMYLYLSLLPTHQPELFSYPGFYCMELKTHLYLRLQFFEFSQSDLGDGFEQ